MASGSSSWSIAYFWSVNYRQVQIGRSEDMSLKSGCRIYNYQKAYHKVHRVCKWIAIPDNVITLLSSLMRKQKTRLEIWRDGENSYSSAGFCISKIPVCKLPKECKGYRIGQPGTRPSHQKRFRNKKYARTTGKRRTIVHEKKRWRKRT